MWIAARGAVPSDAGVVDQAKNEDVIAILRLLCDENLGATARWLRAAGHDAALAAPGQPDAELLAQCQAEGRVLVSRDRRLVQAADAQVRALLLIGDDADAHALALAHGLGLDWTCAPFTRCLVDNTPLERAGDADMARIPAQSRALPGPFRKCPGCGRVFWPGSHVRRMNLRLKHWHDAAASR
jgi:uncharacterized protein with PIN domain